LLLLHFTQLAQVVKLSKPDIYAHLSNTELIESLKRLIKKANSTKDLNPKSAREILLEGRSLGYNNF